jgi:lysozyme
MALAALGGECKIMPNNLYLWPAMTPKDRIQRRQQAIQFAAARAQQAMLLKQHELAVAQFEEQKRLAAAKGWKALFTPTGAVVLAAAFGLLGTAAGKWADYNINKRQQETAIILKASEGVPQNISTEAQAVQRARNLLWFSRAHYIDLPRSFEDELSLESQLPKGSTVPPPILQPPKTGLDLTEGSEGFTPKATQDPGGLRVVGFGHVLTSAELTSGTITVDGKPVAWSHGITQQQAASLLRSDMARHLEVVDALVMVKLTPCQRYALGDFVRNAGPSALTRSNLLARLNKGDYASVTELLPSMAIGHGQVVPGLVRRRQLEVALWSMTDHNEERCNIAAGELAAAPK